MLPNHIKFYKRSCNPSVCVVCCMRLHGVCVSLCALCGSMVCGVCVCVPCAMCRGVYLCVCVPCVALWCVCLCAVCRSVVCLCVCAMCAVVYGVCGMSVSECVSVCVCVCRVLLCGVGGSRRVYLDVPSTRLSSVVPLQADPTGGPAWCSREVTGPYRLH